MSVTWKLKNDHSYIRNIYTTKDVAQAAKHLHRNLNIAGRNKADILDLVAKKTPLGSNYSPLSPLLSELRGRCPLSRKFSKDPQYEVLPSPPSDERLNRRVAMYQDIFARCPAHVASPTKGSDTTRSLRSDTVDRKRQSVSSLGPGSETALSMSIERPRGLMDTDRTVAPAGASGHDTGAIKGDLQQSPDRILDLPL